MVIKELREKKASLASRIKEIAERVDKKAETDEDRQNWKQLNTDYDDITYRLEVAERKLQLDGDKEERQEEAERTASKNRGRRESDFTFDEARALKAWIQSSRGSEISEEDTRHMREAGFRVGGELQIRLRPEVRAQSKGTPSEGGVTVAEGFANRFDQAMLAFGGMRRAAQIIRTAMGNKLPWPTVNDTNNEAVIVAENDPVGEQDTSWGVVNFGDYKYSSQIVKVSAELLQDSAFNIANFLGEALGMRIARGQNRHFTVGDGSAKPRGAITAMVSDGAVVDTEGAGAFTGDDVINLIYAIDQSYREGAAFMLADGITAHVRKMKDGQGQYLWQPGLQAGQPDRLAGYPMVNNQHMDATVAAGNNILAFGDWSKYVIRDIADLRLRRLTERYADTDQEAFVAFLRGDGNMVNAGTNPLKVLQVAA